MANVQCIITILDLPEIMAIIEEALDAVPEWERNDLRRRLTVVLERARARRNDTRSA
jgi:hypothetical protein